jgi:hypothetical protein
MQCPTCPTRLACELWGCRLLTEHPDSIAIPPPAEPLPYPARPVQASAPRGPRSFVVREVGGGWIAQPCEGITPGAESVAVAPDALAALLRAWAAER